MTFSEDITRLRKRLLDAVSHGIVKSDSKDIYEATLIQVLNEAERQRQRCMTQADTLRRQAAVADGQASAYSAIGSIVFNVLNGFVDAAERANREERERAVENAEETGTDTEAEVVDAEYEEVEDADIETTEPEAKPTPAEKAAERRRKRK
jgi:hypothetical protein